ncbi:MAG TPA: hypothetical protein QF428_02460 [Flavobacteriaceae bacterium]|jgi:hypothetical protein|nr:hypothetical protein [Flavobacteriaceae bacterium]HJO70575.1 hypothetical protein [Flavobacteriaceae bacterium]|tara:strand:+ start:1600 stop:2256 length:657 start_codon:yes stop_codon:yes gene_type:complete
MNKKRGLELFLWILSIFFASQIYSSINGPIKFNKVKNERYAIVINRLKDIRIAQIAHKDVKGYYANNFDELVSFIDNGLFTLIEEKDSSYLAYDRIYRIDMLKEVRIVRELGKVSVKDSLFKDNESYKQMAFIPIKGKEDERFSISADIIDKNGYEAHVFEVKVKKDVILYDQNKDLLKQENKVISVDGVNGSEIVLGSMTEVSTSGNWPTIFDANKK